METTGNKDAKSNYNENTLESQDSTVVSGGPLLKGSNKLLKRDHVYMLVIGSLAIGVVLTIYCSRVNGSESGPFKIRKAESFNSGHNRSLDARTQLKENLLSGPPAAVAVS